MIPLTKIQRQILDKFHELPRKTYTFQELEKEMQKIAQDRWLRKQLEKIVSYGFLIRDNEAQDHSIKPVAVYSYNDVVKLELPSYKELISNSNNTCKTNNTNNTNSSNKEKKPSPSNLNNLNHMNYLFSEQKNEEPAKVSTEDIKNE